MRWSVLLLVLLALSIHGCTHAPCVLPDTEPEEGVRTECGTAGARIWALIAKGQFAEAQVLIAEGTRSGLVNQELATRMLHRISQLSTKLGEIPASLQRKAGFPSQLKDYTLFEIKSMLDKKDFSLATQAELKMARKLIEQEKRLMEN
jgi:hypothetical protein